VVGFREAEAYTRRVVVLAGPNWLGSPQHFVVGAIFAVIVFFTARWRRLGPPDWAAFVVAVGVVSTGEIVLELVEYPLLYADRFHYSAYYDTLADMANSVAGAVIGAAVAFLVQRRVSAGSASP
jgi:hypothetical protein